MLELNSRKLSFKFNGEDQLLKFPTVKELRDYSNEYDKAEDKISMISKFLVSLGLNQEVCDQLELGHLETILKELTSSKK
jgi:hypothetical protein